MILNTIKKRAKVIAIILLVLFGASSISYFVYLATALIKNDNDPIALIINNKKIKKSELEFLLSSRSYDESFKVLNMNSFIERNLLLDKAKALHIGVSSQKINEEYKKRIEEMRKNIKLPDNELIVRILARTNPGNYILEKGSPYRILRKVIEDDIILENLKTKIEDSYIPSEEEINAKYEENKKKPLNEVKEEIIKNLKNENKRDYYSYWLENFVNDSSNKVELKDDSYKIYLKQPILVLGDLSISNINFYYNTLIYMQYPFLLNINEELNEEQQKEIIYKKIYEKSSGDLLLANEALKKGLKVKSNLSSDQKIYELVKALRKDISSKLKYSDEDIKTYFNKNKSKYDEKERLYAYTFSLDITPSSEDIYNLRNEAEKILKEALEKKILPSNKKVFIKDEFNKNFDVKLVENEIHPELLKREGSYYIVKALKDKVEYVKIDEKASHKTKDELRKKASNIVKDINDGKITFEKALETYAKENNRKEQGPLYRDSVSIDKDLLNKLFTVKDNEIFVFETANNIYVAKRSKYFPRKEAAFNDFKSRASDDYKKEKTEQEFENLKYKLIKDNKIEIKDENLKNILKI